MSCQKNNNKISFYSAKALLANLSISVLFLFLEFILGGPKIYIENLTAIIVFAVLMTLYSIVTYWSIFSLVKQKMTTSLVISGPYRFVRHPIYAAIIFLLNPALAILLRSWLLVLAILPIYLVWRKYVKDEDQILIKKFGPAYWEYKNSTWCFFPNLSRFNKPVFYILIGLTIFVLVFIILNFSALYLRWAVFEKNQKISYDQTSQTQPSPAYFQEMFGAQRFPDQPDQETVFSPSNYSGQINYNPNPNSIIVSKINVKAPLIMAVGTTQKELNQALNQGVIIYPGSALPGQNGEVLLSGHSSTYPWIKTEYGQVFALLDRLEAGNTVSLVYDNLQYDYRIIQKEVLPPNAVVLSAAQEPTLTLVTCWPIGTTLKRLVIRGELIR